MSSLHNFVDFDDENHNNYCHKTYFRYGTCTRLSGTSSSSSSSSFVLVSSSRSLHALSSSSLPRETTDMISLFIAVGCFYVLYKILEYFPWDKRSVKKLGARALVQRIAHRGSRGEGLPENSKAAFLDACKAGAEVLEVCH